MPPWLTTILLLCVSNVFMTFAWYYHLKDKGWSLWQAVLVSWLIAFFEYTLMVPANRVGHVSHGGPFTLPQLKIIQEAITLTVFGVFSITVMKERLAWSDLAAFALVMAGVAVGMLGKRWNVA